MPISDRLTRIGLAAGIATPVLYFGTQAVAAPFYPHYSFLRQVASELGSDKAVYPTIFNTGVFLTGIATLLAAYGFYRAVKGLGAHAVWTWLSTLALVSCGVASLNAGYFHLPDPRHNPGWLGIGMFLLPFLLPITLWKLNGARRIRTYLIGNLVYLAALAPIMGGVGGLTHDYGGLLQRAFALTLFLPIGFVSGFLWARVASTEA